MRLVFCRYRPRTHVRAGHNLSLSLSLFKFQLIFSFYSSLINECRLFIHIYLYLYWRNVYKRKSGIRPKKRKSPTRPIRVNKKTSPTKAHDEPLGPPTQGLTSLLIFVIFIWVRRLISMEVVSVRDKGFLCYEEVDTAQAQITRAPNLRVWLD